MESRKNFLNEIEKDNLYFWLFCIKEFSNHICFIPSEIIKIIVTMYTHTSSKKDFQSKMQAICGLTLEEIQSSNIVENLAFEFAKLMSPNTIRPWGRVLINGTSYYDIHYNYLVITYKELYGEKKFNTLARLFNEINPNFDAYYTITQVRNDKNFYFALCLNANVFLEELIPTTVSKKINRVNTQDICLYKSYGKLSLNKNEPENKYNLFPLALKVKEFRFFRTFSSRVKAAIELWVTAKINQIDFQFKNLPLFEKIGNYSLFKKNEFDYSSMIQLERFLNLTVSEDILVCIDEDKLAIIQFNNVDQNTMVKVYDEFIRIIGQNSFDKQIDNRNGKMTSYITCNCECLDVLVKSWQPIYINEMIQNTHQRYMCY